MAQRLLRLLIAERVNAVAIADLLAEFNRSDRSEIRKKPLRQVCQTLWIWQSFYFPYVIFTKDIQEPFVVLFRNIHLHLVRTFLKGVNEFHSNARQHQIRFRLLYDVFAFGL